MPVQLQTRNASLNDLVGLLNAQQDVKLDAVVPAQALRSNAGIITIQGVAPVVPDTVDAFMAGGAQVGPARFLPTATADAHLADKLGIGVPYMRKLRDERVDIYDENVNLWLHGSCDGNVSQRGAGPGHGDDGSSGGLVYPPDGRNFLARCFIDPDGGVGILRALLSDRFAAIDNLDVLLAALAGIRDAGIHVNVTGCDLTEQRMYVRVEAPEITAAAPGWLENYRSPFGGGRGIENPLVSAGLVLSNSETGGGAMTVTPRITVLVCKNGATRTQDALRRVHLGAQLEEGVIEWSEDTKVKNVDLVTAAARDAVRSFLSADYLHKVVNEVEQKAGARLENPGEQVKVIAQRLKFSQAQADGILDFFIRGGDTTAGGVLQAVTAYAQTVDNADEASDLEDQAFASLDVAHAVASGR